MPPSKESSIVKTAHGEELGLFLEQLHSCNIINQGRRDEPGCKRLIHEAAVRYVEFDRAPQRIVTVEYDSGDYPVCIYTSCKSCGGLTYDFHWDR